MHYFFYIFREVSKAEAEGTNYVDITYNEGGSSYASVGMIGKGRQNLVLGGLKHR